MKIVRVISIVVTLSIAGVVLFQSYVVANGGLFRDEVGAGIPVDLDLGLASANDPASRSMAEIAVCAQLLPNLISWYRAEGNFVDFQGGTTGTQIGGVVFAAGKVGQAFDFDGVNDIVNVGNPANQQITVALTAEAWIRPDSTFGNYRTVVSKFSQTPNASWGLYVINDTVYGIVGSGAGTFVDARSTGGTIPFGTSAAFSHVAMTYSGADGLKVYLNGALVDADISIGNIHNGPDLVRLGNDSGVVGGRYFDGLVDGVDILNRVLSPAEILTIYNAGSSGKCTAPFAPPANDNFASAQVITGAISSATGTNVAATKQAGEPNHGGNPGGASVWYRWQAPATESAHVNTLGSDFDTLLGIYTGSSLDALTLIGGSDDFI